MTAFAFVGAFVVGAAFGYGAQRGAFCMNSAFRSAIEGDRTKVKALGLAVAVQLLLVPVIFATGLARPAELPLAPMAAVVGGLVFGLSMRWAGGCAAGVWYKLGAGDMGALLALLGMGLGAASSDSGPLAGVRGLAAAGNSKRRVVEAAASSLGGGRRPPTSRVVSTHPGASRCLVLANDRALGRSHGRARLARVGSGWTDFGLAVVPGTTGLLAGAEGRPFPAWDLLLVVGILIGGWLAARQSGLVTLKAPEAAVLVKRFVGGLDLGVGASIASGCTVGQGLTGLALLAPSSFVVMGAVFGGSAAATLLGRRLSTGSGDRARSSLRAERSF